MKKILRKNILINVKYFGIIFEKTNLNSEKIIIKNNDISIIINQIVNKYNLNDISFQISHNFNIINLEEKLKVKDGDEIAFLPPFAGG
tara:strand:+ start:208 stop:471 length:264 start_codon:yes stop_codon:yes gene_type:complete